MGITGELVRSVFSRNRSFKMHGKNIRRNAVEKRKWNSVRSYLCGDEYNSVLAEEDSASVKSSAATVTQPAMEDLTDKEDTPVEHNMEAEPEPVGNWDSSMALKSKERAAVIIQSAFRGFLGRCQNKGLKLKRDKQELAEGTVSPSRESLSTSIEVQTGNSEEVFSVEEERISICHRVQQKAKSQLLKLKEEWDDSTVSSNISKMRIQNRLEATTRRERALAYAFSQQLRICSKRKQAKPDCLEANVSWSWLERWMATRQPESSSIESHASKPEESVCSNNRYWIQRRLFDVGVEEKESCGSNEVPVQPDYFADATKEVDGWKTNKNGFKGTKSVSRRRTAPNNLPPREFNEVSKKDCPIEAEKDKKHRQKQAGGNGEFKSKDAQLKCSHISKPVAL